MESIYLADNILEIYILALKNAKCLFRSQSAFDSHSCFLSGTLVFQLG